jgi:uncharacterized repeat protein (TIGR04138 family)
MPQSTLDWKSVYASMHRDGEAAFPPAALHYVLQLVRKRAGTQAGANTELLTPASIITTFRGSVRGDFGPLTREVLDEWKLRTPEELGKAVLLLGRYRCLTLEPSDTLEAFAIDSEPLWPSDSKEGVTT